MRFLIVYQDFARDARELVQSLGAVEVQVIVAKKGESEPGQRERDLLLAHRGASCAACQVVRSYRKSIKDIVNLEYEPKQFRKEDLILRNWLVPSLVESVDSPLFEPRTAFEAAARSEPRLIIGPKALETANDLVHERWRFASRAASLLERFARGDDLGSFRDWRVNHCVECAVNGQVYFECRLHCGKQVCISKSEWHLKEGDRTTREGAARVYFDKIEVAGLSWVVVTYCGPHPCDGRYECTVEVPEPELIANPRRTPSRL